ncbi:MAG: type III polyketide synthase [Tepidiformaceae bacterium]
MKQGLPTVPVRIVGGAIAKPPFRVSQPEAVERVALLTGDGRRAAALARGSGITERAISLPADQIARLGTIEERNLVYREVAPQLSIEAATGAAGLVSTDSIRCLVTSSCTGMMLPGWPVQVVESLALTPTVMRTPITEAGCAGGVVALARAFDFLQAKPDAAGLVIATELCSLAFHATCEQGALTASVIFGDGSVALALEAGPGAGLRVLGASSYLVPRSADLLGFDLTDNGFYPVLSRALSDRLVPATISAVDALLAEHQLGRGDVQGWLIHPGGARILDGLQQAGGFERAAMRWSRDSLAESGNMSSAAVLDVVRRFLADPEAPAGYCIIAAFGPGVSIELLLAEMHR